MPTIIEVATSDGVIWHCYTVYSKISKAMSENEDILIDLHAEGPDLDSLEFYKFLTDFAQHHAYDLAQIEIRGSNVLESHDQIKIKYIPPMQFVLPIQDALKNNNWLASSNKIESLKHFGMFIGRSNFPRLDIASHLNEYHGDSTILTYHYDPAVEFHGHHIGLDDYLRHNDASELHAVTNFLKKCPVKINTDLNNGQKFNQRPIILDQSFWDISSEYSKFFVELACESYFSGTTFFPTEKVWRPIMLKTPFIVQGPRNFLTNLKKLGFRTFDRWWDEGYSEDPPVWQIKLIKEIINNISKKSAHELQEMYQSMTAVLDHNYQRLLSLTDEDFFKLKQNVRH